MWPHPSEKPIRTSPKVSDVMWPHPSEELKAAKPSLSSTDLYSLSKVSSSISLSPFFRKHPSDGHDASYVVVLPPHEEDNPNNHSYFVGFFLLFISTCILVPGYILVGLGSSIVGWLVLVIGYVVVMVAVLYIFWIRFFHSGPFTTKHFGVADPVKFKAAK